MKNCYLPGKGEWGIDPRSKVGRRKTESAPQGVAVNVEYFTQAKISKVSWLRGSILSENQLLNAKYAIRLGRIAKKNKYCE